MSEKLFDNNFHSIELTKINIKPHEVFADKDDELHHVRLQAQEYMSAQNYDDFIFIKYTHKKQLSALAVNQIFIEVSEKFQTMLSLIDVFSIMSDHFEIDGTELYYKLSTAIQDRLKRELLKLTKYKKYELFCSKSSNGMIMPAL